MVAFAHNIQDAFSTQLSFKYPFDGMIQLDSLRGIQVDHVILENHQG